MFVFLNQFAGFESGVVDENQTSSESNLGSCRAGRQTRETAVIATQFLRGLGMIGARLQTKTRRAHSSL
jgi:hypothetical protein